MPAATLANLPSTAKVTSLDQGGGALIFAVIPTGNPATFTAQGLDTGFVIYSSLSVKTLNVK